uniref:Predicted protein n=1 Tax=Hordeum vulgare subsp. vulgare TaxID=112509 RepID=F2CTZ3_HORVV|nr:predicted protein [Hordeum vulgare subsp. vulgare]
MRISSTQGCSDCDITRGCGGGGGGGDDDGGDVEDINDGHLVELIYICLGHLGAWAPRTGPTR